MTSLLMKIIVCPLAVAICSSLFDNVDYVSWYQPIVVGLVLAFVGYLMEVMLLKRNTTVLSDVADFIASVLIVYFVSAFLANASVTLWGAVLTAIVLTLIEIPTHRWLVRTGRAEKTAG